MTEELRQEKERLINRLRHAFNQGYELGYQQKGEKAYQQGLEDGRKQGVVIDGDKRYWKGYHAAQEDGKKIYQKGYEDGARCQDEVQYQKGLEDSWDAARKIVLDGDDGLNLDELYVIFEDDDPYRIFETFSASEAVEKIREYEEKQKQEEAKERFREKLESGYFSGKQKQEGRSGYVSFVGEKPQEQGVATVYPESPCDLCRFNPPGSGDGKPCTMCPAERKVDE